MTAPTKVLELLARAVGYMSRVETRGREDRERLVFAQTQVLTALAILRDMPLELAPLEECEACGEVCDTPPVCAGCADVEAAVAWAAEQ